MPKLTLILSFKEWVTYNGSDVLKPHSQSQAFQFHMGKLKMGLPYSCSAAHCGSSRGHSFRVVSWRSDPGTAAAMSEVKSPVECHNKQRALREHGCTATCRSLWRTLLSTVKMKKTKRENATQVQRWSSHFLFSKMALFSYSLMPQSKVSPGTLFQDTLLSGVAHKPQCGKISMVF